MSSPAAADADAADRNPSSDSADRRTVRLSEVLAGLSYALDLTEGQRQGHSVRTCLIGMRISEVLGLGPEDRSALFYALLMKDLGCSSNAARFAALFGSHDQDLKSALKVIDWPKTLESFRFVMKHAAPGRFWLSRVWRLFAIMACGPAGAREVVRTRCERGADIARLLGLSEATAGAIRALDEHWDGHGQPYSLKGQEIPPIGRVLGLAQTVEVFASTYDLSTAFAMASARRGTWFDPEVVDALESLRSDGEFWRRVTSEDAIAQVRAMEPEDQVKQADEDQLDLVAEAFARVVDAKSPWTYRHSQGVADVAAAMGARMGLAGQALRDLRRAALLHDLGKLGVSSLILDKPGRLTGEEFASLRAHPAHTAEIFSRVSCFRHLAPIAGAHHERLDGRGYHLGLREDSLPVQARVLAAADICDALRSSRPYRPGLSPERMLDVMSRETGTAIDADCFAALAGIVTEPIEVSAGDAPIAAYVKGLAEDYHQAA